MLALKVRHALRISISVGHVTRFQILSWAMAAEVQYSRLDTGGAAVSVAKGLGTSTY